MKIIVCGDSYCSADSSDERWHFSQVLEDKYNLEVVNLARGGMSNLGICFQIKQAIKLKADVVVYNITDPSRVDIIMNDQYLPAFGLKNFIYHSPEDSSHGSVHVGTVDAPIFSTPIGNLDTLQHFKVPNEKIQAVKQYHLHLFHWQLKYETDRWMFEHWNNQMNQAGIKHISLGSIADVNPGPIGSLLYNFTKQYPEYVAKKLYHTDQATQSLVADMIYQKIS